MKRERERERECVRLKGVHECVCSTWKVLCERVSVCVSVCLCVCQGYRSVEELAASGVLNRQQRIGVKHYHDFQERMPREEVALIEQQVRAY